MSFLTGLQARILPASSFGRETEETFISHSNKINIVPMESITSSPPPQTRPSRNASVTAERTPNDVTLQNRRQPGQHPAFHRTHHRRRQSPRLPKRNQPRTHRPPPRHPRRRTRGVRKSPTLAIRRA